MVFFSLCSGYGYLPYCVYTIFGFKILRGGNTATYSVFLMSGGMLIPYIFGILVLNEELSVYRIIGVVVILFAVFLSSQIKLDFTKKLVLFCIVVFIFNGFSSITSKVHQISPNLEPVSSMSFVMYAGLLRSLLSAITLLFFKPEKAAPKAERKWLPGKKSGILVWLSGAVSGVSYLLQLTGAKTLPASVLYPLITGGSIVFSAIAGKLFFKEKLSKAVVLSIILCLVGTLLFL